MLERTFCRWLLMKLQIHRFTCSGRPDAGKWPHMGGGDGGGGVVCGVEDTHLWSKLQPRWFYGDVTGCTSNNEQVTSEACRIPQTDSYYGTDIKTKGTNSPTLRRPLHLTFSLTAQTTLWSGESAFHFSFLFFS